MFNLFQKKKDINCLGLPKDSMDKMHINEIINMLASFISQDITERCNDFTTNAVRKGYINDDSFSKFYDEIDYYYYFILLCIILPKIERKFPNLHIFKQLKNTVLDTRINRRIQNAVEKGKIPDDNELLLLIRTSLSKELQARMDLYSKAFKEGGDGTKFFLTFSKLVSSENIALTVAIGHTAKRITTFYEDILYEVYKYLETRNK